MHPAGRQAGIPGRSRSGTGSARLVAAPPARHVFGPEPSGAPGRTPAKAVDVRGSACRRAVRGRASQAACAQVGQVQSSHVHDEQASSQWSQEQALWLQVGQVQSEHSHTAQESEQCGQLQVSHSS